MTFITDEILSEGGITGTTLYGDGFNITNLNIPYITGNTATVQARRTTAYTLTGSYTNITFNSTDVENNPSIISHDNTNTDRIYIYESGLYELHYHCDVAQGTTTNDYDFKLVLNNLTDINGSAISGKNSSTDKTIASVNTVYSATSGDYITLQARFPAATGGLVNNTVFSVKQLKGLKGDTGATGPQGPQGIGLFTGGTINADTIFTAGLSATTLNFTTTPTNNNANTEILTRNSTTGDVEYRDSSSLGGGSIDTGKVIALTQIMYF
jgi:hypothetical protein